MPIERLSSHSVAIKERGPYQLARAIKKAAGIIMPDPDDGFYYDSIIEACNDILTRDFSVQYGGEVGRMLSLPFQGQRYVLKYYIFRDKGIIATHPGETPGVEPIKMTAELIDGLASSEENTPVTKLS